MNTPVIDALLASDAEGSSGYVKRDPYNTRLLNNFHNSVKGMEDSLAKKQIFNTEYKDGYQDISRAVEQAFDALGQKPGFLEKFRTESETWNRESDPRMYLWYHPAFANVGGALKKLTKYEKDPLVAEFLPVLREAVQLIELCKQVKPFIVKGRKPNPNYVPPDMSNTGHCAICGKQQKMTKGQEMVDHGFQISDGVHYFGTRVGHCFGVGYKPYELSNEANKEFKAYLEKMLKQTQKNLAELRSGTVTSVQATKEVREGFNYRTEYVTIKKGEPGFDRELQTMVMRAEQQESTLKSDIKVNDSKIAKWQVRPLPEGVSLGIF